MEKLLAECKGEFSLRWLCKTSYFLEAEKIEKSKNSRSRKRKLSISLADEEESGKELPFELPENIVEILQDCLSII